jgi:hypothetical protein
MGTDNTLRDQIEKQFPGIPFHEAIATFILGQWPRLSIHDPGTYIKSMARILGEYADAVVLACADPASGIAQHENIPKMAELTAWLRKEAARQDVMARYGALPSATIPLERRLPPPAFLSLPPNVFVPDDNKDYQRLRERRQTEPPERSRFETRICHDGVRRGGIWVPLGWWREDAGAKALPARQAVEKQKAAIAEDGFGIL